MEAVATTPAQDETSLKQRIQDLYDAGLYLQAHGLAASRGPIQEWTGPEWRILGGRLAGNIGAPRLGMWQMVKAWRLHPEHAEAAWYYARHLADFQGLVSAWRWMRKRGEMPEAPPRVRGPWLALHGHVLARLRDFDAAERWLARAEEITPSQPWIHVEKAFLLTQEDRPEEALRAARRSLDIRAWYRPGVQEVGHLLVQLGRDREALDFLSTAAERLESSAVHYQLAALQIELRLYHDARKSLEEVLRLSPLAEEEMAKAVHARMSDVAYHCGERALAIELARKSEGKFHIELAERLEKATSGGKRVLLDVPFVRQHFQTCVPATLVAVSRFWDMPGDHLEVAAEICYDGTPHASERRWAEEHGWLAREFTVTWEAAQALLDRGVPFTLATADPGNAHLQGVTGYDEARGSLLIREPSDRHLVEFAVERFLTHYAPTGPRGMALVPERERHLLDGIDLPNAALYDELYAVERALKEHDRAAAAACLSRLEAQASDHYVTWLARRALAQYDGDLTTLLACADGMLRLFPDSIMWALTRVGALRQVGREQERRALVKELAERTPTDPMCWQQWAQELALDARQRDQARYLLRRSHRALPGNALVVSTLARLCMDEGRFAEAFELDRFAYCLADKDEGLARNYFISARSQGKSEEALDFLRRRFRRFGRQSGWPARTLFWSLSQLERHEESFCILEEARKLRPDDGEIILFGAEMHGQYGHFKEAHDLLEAARGKVSIAVWTRAAANLAAFAGRLPESLEHWRQVLGAEPLAMDAHAAVARLLAETDKRESALAHLHAAREKFPNHYGLSQIEIEWKRDEGEEKLEPLVRGFLERHPSDAWARRELALTLLGLARYDEALTEIELAEALEPGAALAKAIRGRILIQAGRAAEGQEALRQAIRLSVDFDLAVRELVFSCDTQAQRREALKFIEGELLRQTILGDGLLVFRDVAQNNFPDEELLALLRRVWEARPDLWHAWACLVRQLCGMGRLEEALAIAQQAVERFPLLPALWLDLAQTHHEMHDSVAEIQAIEKALQINPGYAWALRHLSQAHEDAGDLEKSRTALERAIRHAPLMAVNHLSLAEWLWRHSQREEARERVLHALRLDPGLEAGWSRLNEWSAALDNGQTARDFARELTRLRPAEVRSWLVLTRTLTRPEEKEECLAAIERALALKPNSPEAYDLKADVLAQAGRFDEALAACAPAALGQPPPLILRARAAWVRYQRGEADQAVAAMEAVVALDQTYFWAWQTLADWHQARGENQKYLEAAEALVRLSPQSPIALAFRGEARLRLGDKAAGKEDLSRAMGLSPSYALPGLLLFDEQLACGETEPARATLQSLQTHVGGPFVQAREVRWLAQQGERDAAVALTRMIAVGDLRDVWPLGAAVEALERTGWAEDARRVVEEVGRGESCHPEVAIMLAERFPPRNEEEHAARLGTVERAIAAQPQVWKLHDVKADLLAHAGLFDEALAACNPPELQPPPVFLRGRAAWIEHRRGRGRQALAMMRSCIEEDPTYHWAWSCLGQWSEEAQDQATRLWAARGMVKAGPRDPAAHVQLALALRASASPSQARDSLRTALDLAPEYAFAAQTLFDWSLEDDAAGDASAALQKLAAQKDKGEYLRRAVHWEARGENRQEAARRLRELCQNAGERVDLIDRALAAVDEAGWSEESDRALARAMPVSNVVGEAWAKRDAQRMGRPPSRADTVRAFPEGAARTHALAGAAVAACLWGRRDIVEDIVSCHGAELGRKVSDWGIIAYALTTAQAWQGTVNWMFDWRTRDGVQPWMLSNLLTALLNLGREEDAYALARHAVEDRPPDHSRAFLEIWLAFLELCGRDPRSGAARLAGISRQNLGAYHRFVLALAQALADMEQAADRAAVFGQVRAGLAAAAAQCGPMVPDAAVKLAYGRAIRRLADLRGGVSARLWAWFRGLFPLFPASA